MATTSFDRRFVVSDPTALARLREDLDKPRPVVIKKRNSSRDNSKGIALLKRKLSHLKT